ncbi:MAG: hypothetical protein ACT4QF_19665 [Sporichthyaceae bacterium]
MASRPRPAVAAKSATGGAPGRGSRADLARRTARTRVAVAAAAVAVVLAAAMAIAGLAAGTRAAQPDDLGRLSQTGLVLE